MIDVQLHSTQGKQSAKPRIPQAALVGTLSPMVMEVGHQGTMCLTRCILILSWEMSRLPIRLLQLFSGIVSLEPYVILSN
jgi:hypothetical protein